MDTINEKAIKSAIDAFPTMMYKEYRPIHEQGFRAGVEFVQRWIPIEEELPILLDTILLKDEYDKVQVGWLTKIGFNVEHISDFTVTHWRPIELE